MPDTQPLKVMHVFGSRREPGFAHGQLLSTDIIDFVVNEPDDYYRSEVTNSVDRFRNGCRAW